MAVTVTDLRSTLNEADSTTSWTASSGSPALVTSDPDPVEATGHIGLVVSTATVDAYVTISSTSFTGKVLYGWALPLGAMDTLVNGGVALQVGDGTNRVAYHLAGSDVAVFRHNGGQPFYECMVMDQSNLPTNKTVRAGSEGSLNWGAITQVGVMFKTLAKSKGGVQNCFIDILRLLDPAINNGCALAITGGTSGDPGTFLEVANEDAAITNLKAHGVVRQLAAGAFGVQGPLRFGNATGTSASWFEDKNVTVVFEQRSLTTSRYKIFITDNGTGTTTFRLGTKVGSGVTATGADGVIINAATGVGWEFDADSDPDNTDVFIYGSTFNGASQGVGFRSGMEFIGGVISNSGLVRSGGATLVNSSIIGSLAATDTSALRWAVATDPDTHLHGVSISKGTNAHHAIEFGLTSPTTMTLRSMAFTGFNAANGNNDSTLHIKRTTGTVTINLIGVTGNVSYKTDGATVTLVINPVALTITAKNIDTGANVQGARVLALAAAGGGLPADVSVSITRSGSTATVTHTSHGLATNDKVRIKGATEVEYNGVFIITNTGVNTYTYTVSGTPATPATGAPVSSYVIIDADTNSSGVASATRSYSVNQPIEGFVRKGSSGSVFKPSPLTGTIDKDNGLPVTVQLIPDV